MYKDHMPHARPAYQHENDPKSEVMLSKPPPVPTNQYSDVNSKTTNNATTFAANVSVHNLIEESVNASTFKPEQQNAFYKSYDPSIGLHTAAVLGGILVWLVLYVIYRTKIRKCVIRAVKRKFGSLDNLSSKKAPGVNGSDVNSSSGATNPNATKPLINPSIVIETSPPESSPKSPSTYDQFFKPGCGNDCLSPYSLPGGNVNEDGMIFQFPCVHNHHSAYHCTDHRDSLQQQAQHLQLPKSELDIPNATAQWVQSMPLAARSYQDFTGLMFNMHCQEYLSLHKPCSCPHVCATPTTKLPVLDMPYAWNNSLPVLSNSVSYQFLGAYEPINNHKDIKDLINAKRKLSYTLKGEQDSLNEKILQTLDSNRRSNKKEDNLNKKKEQRQSRIKKSCKNPANLTIRIPESKENATLINNTTYSRSPVPIPVTPTVMIQNTTKAPNRRRGCHDSNTSISSSSSNDLLPTATTLPPPIHITVADPSQSHSYHLSPVCTDRLRSPGGPHAGCCDATMESVNSLNQARVGPSCYSPYHFIPSHCQCLLKHSKHNNNSGLHRQNSIAECQYSRKANNNEHLSGNGSHFNFHHRRSMSDYNRHGHGHSHHVNPLFHQRSLSADISVGHNNYNNNNNNSFQHDPNNANNFPYGGGGLRNSASPGGAPSAPSPNLLQVPDANSGMPKDRPYSLDIYPSSSVYSSNSSLYHGGSTTPHGSSGGASSQLCLRHAASNSDSNIAYYRGGSHRPISPLVDIPQDRRHSSIVPGSTGSPLLHNYNCSDLGSSRSRSSYFLPLQAMPLSPACSTQHFTPQQTPSQTQTPDAASANDPEQSVQKSEQQHQQQPTVPSQRSPSNPGSDVTSSDSNQNSSGFPVTTRSTVMETKL